MWLFALFCFVFLFMFSPKRCFLFCFVFFKAHSVGWIVFHSKRGNKMHAYLKSYSFPLDSVRWKQLSWYGRMMETLACCPILCLRYATILKKMGCETWHPFLRCSKLWFYFPWPCKGCLWNTFYLWLRTIVVVGRYTKVTQNEKLRYPSLNTVFIRIYTFV